MGRLIVIEGLDGSGKSTQLEVLEQNLINLGVDVKTVSFPDYESNSSALVKMYLSGEFGSAPGDVNPFAASLFYAVDRYASYKTNWGTHYENGGIILSGRYTTSNGVHQTSKLPREEWESFTEWLYFTEYQKVAIPKPDLVIFLDMPTDVSQRLLSGRYGGDEQKKDIHERDVEYLAKCREAALFNAEKFGWKTVNCARDGEARTIDDIAQEVLSLVKEVI